MRILDFTDGFSSASEPTQGNISASGVQIYTSDAAFVTAKGAAAAAGDFYYNSTINALRFHDGTDFISLDGLLLPQTPFTIANNVSSAASVTGATFDKDDFTSAVVEWEILRSTDNPIEVMARGRCSLFFKPSAGWQIENESEGDSVGVTFTALDTAGVVQLQYTSTNLAGGSYVGTMKFTIKDPMRA